MKHFRLHWISHELMTSLRPIQMETRRDLLLILNTPEKNKFQRVVTEDESWFTLEFHHSMKWRISRDDVLQKVKPQIGTQQFTVTVIWGIDGFHVVDLMTEQHNYNRQSFLSHILELLLLAGFTDGHKLHSRRLSLTTVASTAQRSVRTLLLKILLFEYPIRLTVLTWHHLTSGLSGT
jgi:hypothetical protein